MWDVFDQKLQEFAQQGIKVYFWFRDDDMGEPKDTAIRLMGLFERFETPITISVVPADMSEYITDFLKRCPYATVVQHGYDHINYCEEPGVKDEFPSSRKLADMEQALVKGRERLVSLFGKQFLNMFVPPWYNICDELYSRLLALGYDSVSIFGNDPVCADTFTELLRVDPLVDIIDWNTSNRFAGDVYALRQMVRQLDECLSKQNPYAVIGILSHHKTMGSIGFEFLENLLRRLRHNGIVYLPDMESLIRLLRDIKVSA